jgi:hypothetical protein
VEEQKARTTNTGAGVEIAAIAGGAPEQPNPPDNSIRIHAGGMEDEPPPRKPDRHHHRGTKDPMRPVTMDKANYPRSTGTKGVFTAGGGFLAPLPHRHRRR